MNRAIELLQEDLDIKIKEFTIAGVRHGSLFAHRWYIGTDDHLEGNRAAKIIDEHLKNLNDDYRVERMEAIKEVWVTVLPSKVFYNYMKESGKEGSANKFPRVLKNSRIDEWNEYLESNNLLIKKPILI
ncbi:MAG TPA: GH3 auxin-responsive promoter family protein, partial [Bacteroidales bacterium]|nr:GH3 auxin-responsive promoter family protein [Bacteroidales bacterium]